MIAFLEGTIQKKLNGNIILNTGDIGYLVNISSNNLAELEENDHLSLFIHTSVREDDISLFGFRELEDLELFKKLISVSGVGPKTGLEILNNSAKGIKYAISQGDTDLLEKTPGIGKKTAQRIIIDLKNKVSQTQKPDDYIDTKNINRDAIKALEKLGFRKHQIINRLKNIPEDITNEEEIIRYFLQNA
ncbi:Holliday junction branch migration protein RuvA [bacterium]|nr:Holliday junction branch migration protein RuvA [bacterium]